MSLFKRDLDPAEVVAKSREDRYSANYIIQSLFTDFFEMHGDRLNGDDPSIIAGVAMLNEQPVTVIAIDKGVTLDEKMAKRNGSPTPNGYRKAQRMMEQAEKFRRPIITFINTPGAYPGKEAEENGQGEAIAQSILKSMKLTVPVIAIIYGEGGSGGALALATADEVWMLENATYSVLSPEGFASILWKDGKRSDEAARLMGLTANELADEGIVDYVIPEGWTKRRLMRLMQLKLEQTIERLMKLDPQELLSRRRQRFRKF
ncbi:acetyl-CoA carboxylase carboxyl transferase subunit alpha [Weissella uvarum]|uniref:acetyl-CoA carboxylase carboxyltransferase subunit alpha n=1 Tax=Weissella uvarum TaxID=1479233 RepID=UPI00196211E4|nr:carboxyltransferase subunit alpha [Weissella uvarum]MBM7617721.1 acetyl-CoA carboxylase carboxyl transferase subunit alpha [Weissella uvarum]MCM0595900.1 acetyl-CoA carboxylase carboxyl transferase subunit alpha [Weissella uvarum]